MYFRKGIIKKFMLIDFVDYKNNGQGSVFCSTLLLVGRFLYSQFFQKHYALGFLVLNWLCICELLGFGFCLKNFTRLSCLVCACCSLPIKCGYFAFAWCFYWVGNVGVFSVLIRIFSNNY